MRVREFISKCNKLYKSGEKLKLVLLVKNTTGLGLYDTKTRVVDNLESKNIGKEIIEKLSNEKWVKDNIKEIERFDPKFIKRIRRYKYEGL